jgi:two-component system, chemotaxis family, sensor kinase CheA
MDDLEPFKQTFFQECDELLADLEAQLMALEEDAADAEALHAAFRAIHSIKGGAAMFGFSRLVSFAHTVESVLDLMRAGRAAPTAGLIAATVRAGDVLAELVQAASGAIQLEEGYETQAAEQLAAAAGIETQGEAYVRKLGNGPRRGGTPQGANHQSRRVYSIAFRPKKDMLRRANEPLAIVRNLKELGTLTTTADLSGLPPFADLVPTDSYLAWTFGLETSADPAAIKKVFEFVEGNCELSITPVDGRDDSDESAASAPDAAPSESAAAEKTPCDAALPSEPAQDAPSMAESKFGRPPTAPSQRISSIRVDLDSVDRLVNLVGEIAIAQAMVLQQIDQTLIHANPQLFRDLSQLVQHTRNLQDSVMAIRAQAVRSIFARMPRVVRELAAHIGKKISIEMSGESTEIDKTIIEELSDPLVHIIRNAVDHGIEPVEERVAKGKPAHGTIRMSAAQRGSRIVIEVSDDGRGIDRDKVRRAAIQKNLITADAQLTDEETDNLIFLPGLSTAETISNISGRGVGMDVVYRNLQKLGGRVTVRSEPGCGATTILTLPLTLAVLDGMIVRTGRESYVIPLGTIVECLTISKQQVKVIPSSGEVLNVRGTHVKLVHLARVFDIADAGGAPQLLVILVEVENGGTIGLVVDEIVGQQQVVIKSVRENFGHVAGIAGATILSDGAVALILDVSAIVELSAPSESGRLHRPTLHADIGKQVA